MSRAVRRVVLILLGLWLVGGVVLGGAMLVQHLVALPTPPPSNAALGAQMRRLFAGGDAETNGHGHGQGHDHGHDQWRVLHVMYRACPCSQRTIAHLTAAQRPAELDEVVVLVDDEGKPGAEDRQLAAHGYRVSVITPEALRRDFDLEAAPVLVIARPDGEVVYAGGYTRHKQSDAFEDLAILSELRQREDRAALPVFGCPTSDRLARQLDPLGLRSK